jgi:hypothetical protein
VFAPLRHPCRPAHEAGAVGDLRGRGLRAEVPDEGRQQIPPGLQEGREVEGLETPEQDVAAGRADSHAAAVHAQDEALVRAHVRDETGRDRRELDHLPEAIDARSRPEARAGDPAPVHWRWRTASEMGRPLLDVAAGDGLARPIRRARRERRGISFIGRSSARRRIV